MLQIKCKWSIYRWWWSCPWGSCSRSLPQPPCIRRCVGCQAGASAAYICQWVARQFAMKKHMDKGIELNGWAVREHPKGTVSVNLNWQPAAGNHTISFRWVAFLLGNRSACDAGIRHSCATKIPLCPQNREKENEFCESKYLSAVHSR